MFRTKQEETKTQKPKIKDFVKEIPWTDSGGKPRVAGAIDFAGYAFALEKYIAQLEQEMKKNVSTM